MNEINLIGHIGQDPELKNLEGGHNLCTFSVATNNGYKSKSGEFVEQPATWHTIKTWNKLATKCASLSKGQKVFVKGKQLNRMYEDKNGDKKLASEVNAFRVELFASIDKSDRNSDDFKSSNRPPINNNVSSDGFIHPTKSETIKSPENDDLPF